MWCVVVILSHLCLGLSHSLWSHLFALLGDSSALFLSDRCFYFMRSLPTLSYSHFFGLHRKMPGVLCYSKQFANFSRNIWLLTKLGYSPHE